MNKESHFCGDAKMDMKMFTRNNFVMIKKNLIIFFLETRMRAANVPNIHTNFFREIMAFVLLSLFPRSKKVLLYYLTNKFFIE